MILTNKLGIKSTRIGQRRRKNKQTKSESFI